MHVNWHSITAAERHVESPESSPAPPESRARSLVDRAPWWAVSVGLHALVLLIVGTFWAWSALAEEEAVVVRPPRRPRPMPVLEKPKDLDPNRKILDTDKSVEDPVYRKDAVESDHTETADEEEFEKAKGDSLDFVSDRPFQGKGTFDVIGGGGGGGGRYGTRVGGRRDLVARGGGGADTEDAVLAALRWLARHQSPDGSWRVKEYTRRCNRFEHWRKGGKCRPENGRPEYDTGVTGLAVLAFLGAGYSHLSRDVYDGVSFGDVVRKGLQWLMAHQDPEGCIGPKKGHYMYNHAIGALALAEAYGLTGSSLFKDNAQRAVDYVVASQNPDQGWRYSYRSGDNDTSVTGWSVMALKSAEISGLAFPGRCYEGTRKWLDSVTEKGYGYVGYDKKGDFENRKAMTAIGAMSRIFMDKNRNDSRVSSGLRWLLNFTPEWKKGKVDFYYWYYGSLAFFQYDGPNGIRWREWNRPMKQALLEHQKRGRGLCRDGSWEPAGRWCWGGGRVYATAVNCLTFEVYYRYANVFGAR